jgi:hypothetical protein
LFFTLLTLRLKKKRVLKLRQQNISFIIGEVSQNKINIFFGSDDCIAVIRQFGNRHLNQLTPEEDFILGIMLGYDRLKQCKRYIEMVNKKENNIYSQSAFFS